MVFAEEIEIEQNIESDHFLFILEADCDDHFELAAENLVEILIVNVDLTGAVGVDCPQN